MCVKNNKILFWAPVQCIQWQDNQLVKGGCCFTGTKPASRPCQTLKWDRFSSAYFSQRHHIVRHNTHMRLCYTALWRALCFDTLQSSTLHGNERPQCAEIVGVDWWKTKLTRTGHWIAQFKQRKHSYSSLMIWNRFDCIAQERNQRGFPSEIPPAFLSEPR